MLNEVNNISQRSRKPEFQFDEVDVQSSERPILQTFDCSLTGRISSLKG